MEKKKSELLVSSSLNEFDLMALYLILPLEKEIVFTEKIFVLKVVLPLGLSFTCFDEDDRLNLAAVLYAFVHYARSCSSVLVTQRALRIIQAFQKSELQLDLATFSMQEQFFSRLPKKGKLFPSLEKNTKAHTAKSCDF